MNTRVAELMVASVVTAKPTDSLEAAREMMTGHGIRVLPVADDEGIPIGIISAMDLLEDHNGALLVGEIMTHHVNTVAQYDSPHIAARVMRNHRIHHVVVTHEQRIVGILSTFDLLRLVEDHRYATKHPPTPTKRGGGRQ